MSKSAEANPTDNTTGLRAAIDRMVTEQFPSAARASAPRTQASRAAAKTAPIGSGKGLLAAVDRMVAEQFPSAASANSRRNEVPRAAAAFPAPGARISNSPMAPATAPKAHVAAEADIPAGYRAAPWSAELLIGRLGTGLTTQQKVAAILGGPGTEKEQLAAIGQLAEVPS